MDFMPFWLGADRVRYFLLLFASDSYFMCRFLDTSANYSQILKNSMQEIMKWQWAQGRIPVVLRVSA